MVYVLFGGMTATTWVQIIKASVSVPGNELRFLNKLSKFKNIDIRKATTDAFKRHLWYLSEVTVGVAFFDRNIGVEEKKDMIT